MLRDAPRADEVDLGYYDLGSQLLAIEVLRSGFEPTWLRRDLFVVPDRSGWSAFWRTQTPATSQVGVRIAKQKDLAADLLRLSGLSVPEGTTFSLAEVEEAQAYARQLAAPVVVKPVDGRKGRAVAVGVHPGDELARALEAAVQTRRGRALVERQFTGGGEARFLVVGGECLAAYSKRPPHVIGDGSHTVAELIEAKNVIRRASPYLQNRLLTLDAERVRWLRERGLTPGSIPSRDVEVVLDLNANVSVGGEHIDITDVVHPSYKQIAVTAAAALDHLEPAGVDVLARDLHAPATPSSYVVCEVNSGPAIGPYHFPLVGEPRNVAARIVERSLPRRQRRRLRGPVRRPG